MDSLYACQGTLYITYPPGVCTITGGLDDLKLLKTCQTGFEGEYAYET